MKFALITGATSGIGFELAKLFAQNGYGLVLVSSNQNQVSNPHFKWGFNCNPSGVYYWFRQRRVRYHH